MGISRRLFFKGVGLALEAFGLGGLGPPPGMWIIVSVHRVYGF